jgi:hypothetical protein
MKETDNLPYVEVSEEEFKKLLLESGEDPKNINMRVAVSRGLGAHCRIGNQMVMVKKNDTDEVNTV